MAQLETERPADEVEVIRVIDPDSEDLHEALDLYCERIPESERFEPPDIIRWIREDAEQTARGDLRPRDFFLVAKLNRQVCGFLLFHYYPTAQFAFVAYLVAAKDSSSANACRDGIAKRLLAEVRQLLNGEGPIKDCQGILLEVDRPSSAVTEHQWIERLARIRLFCMLSEAQGLSLRAFDMDYLQPPLSLADPDVNVPLLLMYVNPKASRPENSMSQTSVRKILKFIYTELYPEGYSSNDRENRAYKSCLTKFCTARAKTVSKRTRLLDYKQLKASMHKPERLVAEVAPPETEYEYDVFISYRRQDPDRKFAINLVKSLESAGLVAAIDERDFDPVSSFVEEMERCITTSRFTLCVLSPRYFESGNTQEEANICKVMDMSERRRRLIPLIIEEVRRPGWLYNIVGIDFTQSEPMFDPMEKLINGLKKGCQK